MCRCGNFFKTENALKREDPRFQKKAHLGSKQWKQTRPSPFACLRPLLWTVVGRPGLPEDLFVTNRLDNPFEINWSEFTCKGFKRPLLSEFKSGFEFTRPPLNSEDPLRIATGSPRFEIRGAPPNSNLDLNSQAPPGIDPLPPNPFRFFLERFLR